MASERLLSRPPSLAELRSGALDLLEHPVWVLDPERSVNVYANRAALNFWQAASVEELAARSHADMSDVSRARLNEILRGLAAGRAVADRWTFYPNGRPATMDLVHSSIRLDDGRPGILIEGGPATVDAVDRRAAEALHYAPVIATLFDESGAVLFRNPAAIAAYPGDDHRFLDRFVDAAEGRELWERLVAGEAISTFARVHIGGRLRWHGLDARRTTDPVTGHPSYLVNERDVTELETAMAELRERERQLSEAQEIGRLGDWRFDVASQRVRLSSALAAILGIDGLLVDLATFLAAVHAEDQALFCHLLQRIAADGVTREIVCRLVSGEEVVGYVWHRCGADRASEEVGAGIVGIARDVTEEVRARERSDYLLWHDGLTGLVNRGRLREMLAEVLRRAPDSSGCVMVLDIDHFKEVNDTRGHAAGDEVLGEVGRRLRAAARATDVVGRLGGDEFGIVLAGLHDAEVLDRRAQSFLKVLSAPILVDGALVSIGASIGMAVWPADGADPDELMRSAELALASLKAEAVGGSAAFFTRAMQEAVDERRRVVGALPGAIDRGEIEVHYQPIVRLRTRELAGFEALVRWRHPERGLVMPDAFVGIAEDAGLMWRLGAYVLETALGQMRRWLDGGFAPGRIAVNLGAGQLQNRGLSGFVRDGLARSGLTPDQLELEVTETVTLRRRAAVIAGTLEDLHRLGVSIVLDDFGTGHASLTHLKRLPIDRLKIDRSFVANIEADDSDAAIVRTLIGLARDLRIAVVAEGVETERQALLLDEAGCEFAQGYLFGHPMAAADATRWLERQRLSAL